jgi:hypothetical protein
MTCLFRVPKILIMAVFFGKTKSESKYFVCVRVIEILIRARLFGGEMSESKYIQNKVRQLLYLVFRPDLRYLYTNVNDKK